MTSTPAEVLRAARAVAACRAYADARADIARLTKAIGRALDGCPQAVGDDFGNFGETHLRQAYSHEKDEDGNIRFFAAYRDEFEAKLAECDHCTEAHHLVQDRKAAKQRYGVAKRNVLHVGRAIQLAEQGEGS